MAEITSKPDWGAILTEKGIANPRLQEYLDDITRFLNGNLLGASVLLPEYTVATLPDAGENDKGAIIVSDETGGRTIATSDATNWLRVSDGAIVS